MLINHIFLLVASMTHVDVSSPVIRRPSYRAFCESLHGSLDVRGCGIVVCENAVCNRDEPITTRDTG